MAVAFDAVSSQQNAAATSQTISHTCTGANLVLYVITGGWDQTGRSITVTYAGTAMTEIAVSDASTGNDKTWLFRLVAPATGANNIVVTITGGVMHIRTGGISLTGAHQTTFSTPQTGITETAILISDTFASAVGDMIVYGATVGNDDTHTPLTGSNLTERYDLNGSGNGEGAAGGTAPGAASLSVGIEWLTSGTAAGAGVNVKAAAADVAFVNRPFRPMPMI